MDGGAPYGIRLIEMVLIAARCLLFYGGLLGALFMMFGPLAGLITFHQLTPYHSIGIQSPIDK